MEHFCWDDDQIEHIAQHGVSVDEFEQAYLNFIRRTISRSSGRLARIGRTDGGRLLFVVFELELIDGVAFISPVTAYDFEA